MIGDAPQKFDNTSMQSKLGAMLFFTSLKSSFF